MAETETQDQAYVDNGVKVVQTDVGSKDGQVKCPKCGSTDISTNAATGQLRCNFCRFEFEPQKLEMETDISKLSGTTIGSGAQDIVADTKDQITLKCTSCGAEVVIDTASANQARCHWCRNTLSLNQQIPNGAIPDMVLAFKVKKDEAKKAIESFVGKRKFYAHPKFRQEFTTNNIMGVYFPYMVVDLNAHSHLTGLGEHQTRSYSEGSGEHRVTYYDADLYQVGRDFDLTIHGLSIESNKDRLDTTNKTKTNNIINSIMPFDVENSVKYDSNYLKGFTSERRDSNITELTPIITERAKDIARFSANASLKNYDRGVSWQSEQLDIKGQQWKAAYLPVWLYSYQEDKGDRKLLHYVAVNARTKESMGSVPIYLPKLFLFAFLVELLGIFGFIKLDFDYDFLLLLVGPLYFFYIYTKYRNQNARDQYETETKTNVTNLKTMDHFVEHRKRLRNSMIENQNNTSVRGASMNLKKKTGLGLDLDLKNFAADQLSSITDQFLK